MLQGHGLLVRASLIEVRLLPLHLLKKLVHELARHLAVVSLQCRLHAVFVARGRLLNLNLHLVRAVRLVVNRASFAGDCLDFASRVLVI